MAETFSITELPHRRSSVFVDEFVDRFSAMGISWNGEERLHLTFGRDSLEVISEKIVPDPANTENAILAPGSSTAYRNDIASLTIPLEVAESLAVTILNMIEQARERDRGEPKK